MSTLPGRPIALADHPLHDRRYRLPTPPIEGLYTLITDALDRRRPGVMVYGRSRLGKTTAIVDLCRRYARFHELRPRHDSPFERHVTVFFRICPTCLEPQRLKDHRLRRLDTVFGTVRFRSPRLVACGCEPPFFLEVDYCPFMLLIPERSTPELQRLQATLASEMS